MRKLILLALGGAAAAYVLRHRSRQNAQSPAEAAPGDDAPASQRPAPAARTEASTADTVESEAVVPDTSADDPLVREQENAAAAQAASIGGPADTVTSDVEPEMRPVVEGSGDAEETFEKTEEEGR
jgi:hypothetical protein